MVEAAKQSIDHSNVSQDDIDRASRSIKAMSHPLRLKILCILGDSEFSVQDIVDTVGTSQSNISQHLGILKDKGVLVTRKEANKVFYRVSDERTLKLLEMMREVGEYIGQYFSKNYVYKNILRMTDEDIDEMKKEIDKEREEEPQEDMGDIDV